MTGFDPTRRLWLQRAWWIGCAAVLPGCDARSPAVPKTAAPSAESPPTAAPAAPGGEAVEPGKISKAAAEYRDTPKGDQRCSNCALFQPGTDTCRLVSGQVSPDGWCKYWAIRPAG